MKKHWHKLQSCGKGHDFLQCLIVWLQGESGRILVRFWSMASQCSSSIQDWAVGRLLCNHFARFGDQYQGNLQNHHGIQKPHARRFGSKLLSFLQPGNAIRQKPSTVLILHSAIRMQHLSLKRLPGLQSKSNPNQASKDPSRSC